MKFVKAILFTGLGVMLGIAGHMAWQSLLSPPATVSGVLRFEPQTNPAVSASHPAGFYVESRVYLTNAMQDNVGQPVRASGYIGLTKDSDAPSYPKIENKELTILKVDGMKAPPTVSTSAETSPQALIELIKHQPDTIKDVYLTLTGSAVNLKDGRTLRTDSIELQGEVDKAAKEAGVASCWE